MNVVSTTRWSLGLLCICLFRVRAFTRHGDRSMATCSKPTSWVGRWFGWRAPRTCVRFWWASTRWWRWTGHRAPRRCWDPTHWPTASEIFTARRGRSVCTQAHSYSLNQSDISKITIKYSEDLQGFFCPIQTHQFHWPESWSHDHGRHVCWYVNARKVFLWHFGSIPPYGYDWNHSCLDQFFQVQLFPVSVSYAKLKFCAIVRGDPWSVGVCLSDGNTGSDRAGLFLLKAAECPQSESNEMLCSLCKAEGS